MNTKTLRNLLAATAAVTALSLPLAAHADDDCGYVAKEQWMSMEQVRAKAGELGYDVRKIEIDDGCYEAYAIDRNGNRVEAYFHPATGDLVKAKIDD